MGLLEIIRQNMEVLEIDHRGLEGLVYHSCLVVVPEFRLRHRIRIRVVGQAPFNISISAPIYVTNPGDVASFTEEYPEAMSKKGLLIELDMLGDAMKLGANHPMGPLELGDFIGLDICLAIMDVLYNETGDSKYRACPLIRKMVRGGNLGCKTGKGFYVYNADRTKTPVDQL